jgi:hypothetical protein
MLFRYLFQARVLVSELLTLELDYIEAVLKKCVFKFICLPCHNISERLAFLNDGESPYDLYGIETTLK